MNAPRLKLKPNNKPTRIFLLFLFSTLSLSLGKTEESIIRVVQPAAGSPEEVKSGTAATISVDVCMPIEIPDAITVTVPPAGQEFVIQPAQWAHECWEDRWFSEESSIGIMTQPQHGGVVSAVTGSTRFLFHADMSASTQDNDYFIYRYFSEEDTLVGERFGVVFLKKQGTNNPPEPISQEVNMDFSYDNGEFKEIVLGQDPALTYTVLAAGWLTTDINNNYVAPTIFGPTIVPKDSLGRAVVYYFPYAILKTSDQIIFEAKNAAGETRLGIVRINVDYGLSIRLFKEDPLQNGFDQPIATTNQLMPRTDITVNTITAQLENSLSASDYKTIWAVAMMRDDVHTGDPGFSAGNFLIDNLPPYLEWVEAPADNAYVTGTVDFKVIAVDNLGDGGIQEVRFLPPQVQIHTVLPQPTVGQPWTKSYDTGQISPEGLYTFKFSAVDRANLVSSELLKPLNIGNEPNNENQIVVKTPQFSGQYVGGELRLRVDNNSSISSLQMVINGNPIDVSLTEGHYDYVLDTRPPFPDGPITIYARYNTVDGATLDTPTITRLVDNTAPTLTKLLPTQLALDRGFAGPVTFRVDATDGAHGEINHVDFYLGPTKIASPSSPPYEFTLDTSQYPDGAAHVIVVGYDQAGNPSAGQTTYSFRITNNNPPPAGYLIPHPAHEAFVSGDDEAEIYVSFEGESPDIASVNQDSIIVEITKDGQKTRLEKIDAVDFDQATQRLKFNMRIPENSLVEWRVNARSTLGNSYVGLFRFTRAMSKTDGGFVTTSDQLFKLDIPENALPEDVLITITDEMNTGGKIIAGPYRITAINRHGESVVAIDKDISCMYTIPPSQYDPNVPRVFQLAELFDNQKIFPLGSSKKPAQEDPLGVHSIDAKISRFGRFVITSEIIPGEGLTLFYNFPNPFNPHQSKTDFHYYLSADSSISIVVYDLFGQVVRSFDIPMGSTGGKIGKNLFTWDGRNGSGEIIANGGYVARVFAVDSQGNRSKATYKVGVLK